MRIIISRTDSIGDVILTLPLCGWIKNNIPNSTVIFLCQKLTKPIIERCRYVDEIVVWQGDLPHADAILHIFPQPDISALAKKKNIPIRVGTSHRIYHFLTCNRWVNFSRIKSEAHESQLNFELLRGLHKIVQPDLSELPTLVGWQKRETSNDFLKSNAFNLIFHMKSRGSAKEWPVRHYSQLAKSLGGKFNIILTGTESEKNLIQKEDPEIFNLPNLSDSTGKLSLSELIDLIGSTDGMLACSTGPLHIAGVSNIRTLGLYPSKKPMYAKRWRPLGKHVEILSEKTENPKGLLDINVERVEEKILGWLS